MVAAGSIPSYMTVMAGWPEETAFFSRASASAGCQDQEKCEAALRKALGNP